MIYEHLHLAPAKYNIVVVKNIHLIVLTKLLCQVH